jgi:hypothetical protein
LKETSQIVSICGVSRLLAGRKFLYNARALLPGKQWNTLLKFRREDSYYRKSPAVTLDRVARDTAKTGYWTAADWCSESRDSEFNYLIVVAIRWLSTRLRTGFSRKREAGFFY